MVTTVSRLNPMAETIRFLEQSVILQLGAIGHHATGAETAEDPMMP